MILNYDFGRGNFEYEIDYEDVVREVEKLLTDDMLSNYCYKNKLNKQTDKEEIEKARKIIAFTFKEFDMGIDEFNDWVERYRGELEDIFYDEAYEAFRYGDD